MIDKETVLPQIGKNWHDKDRWNVYTIYAVQLIRTNFCCFYLYNVHIKECSFDKCDNPILQVQ